MLRSTSAALFYRRPQRHPLPEADAAIERLAAQTAQVQTAVISTLDVYKRIADQIDDVARALGRPEVGCLPHSVGDHWRWWPLRNTYVRRFGPDTVPLFQKNYELLTQLIVAFQRAGVPVPAGTDTPTPMMVPGFSLHDELVALVRAGFTPYEALKTATVNPAKFLNTDRGTLERGKRADAVLLDENPLDDITHTSRIAGVLLNGRWLRRVDIEKIPETKDGRCSAAFRTTR